MRNLIKKVLRESELDWITQPNLDPWSDIPKDILDQITDDEKKIITKAFESDISSWKSWAGCDSVTHKINSVEIDDEWWHKGRWTEGIKIRFSATCYGGDYADINTSTLILFIDRETGEWGIN